MSTLGYPNPNLRPSSLDKIGPPSSPKDKRPTVKFEFNPIISEEWRSNVAPIIQLVASGVLSIEEARQRLQLGPKKDAQTFMPFPPPQMTPGQANKITTDPRTSGGLQNPKGVVSKPPEQQEPRKGERHKVEWQDDGSAIIERIQD